MSVNLSYKDILDSGLLLARNQMWALKKQALENFVNNEIIPRMEVGLTGLSLYIGTATFSSKYGALGAYDLKDALEALKYTVEIEHEDVPEGYVSHDILRVIWER